MNAGNNGAAGAGRPECLYTMGVPIKDYYTVAEVGLLLHVSREKIRRWEHMDEDPFPILYLPGRSRGGVVQRDDMHRWIVRNSTTVTGDTPADLLS